ncbi:MAG: hypothetical protein LBV69_05810 [Bacteroidales bacterium]|jgi:hypothetical protein|nr:hypothetical protein [Bacteroidales bacterium]
MKKVISTTILVLLVSIVYGQTKTAKGFSNFNEFLENKPTMTFEFQLKKRTNGDIFMTGGISNYRAKKITPKNNAEKVEKELWGISIGDTVYINSYPYSKIVGYNQIIEKGYYTYFIGEPARAEKEQRELGIIKATEKQIAVCCQVGYVILLDGTIKLLRPELLLDLCKDNENLVTKIKEANLKFEDVLKMFDFLAKYNLTKNN